MSAEALAALRDSSAVLLRTSVHPGAERLSELGIAFETADDLYGSARDFSVLYQAIAERALSLAEKHGDLAYAVPGHPLFGERSCALLLDRGKQRGVTFEIISGQDFVTATLEVIGQPFDSHLTIVNAHEMDRLLLDPRAPILAYQVDSREAATEAKLTLMKMFPDEHEVLVVADARGPDQRIMQIPLFEMDHHEHNPRTSVYVPALDLPRPPGFYGLVDVVATLRGPGGCPWDIEQSHDTLKKHLIEESYEVLDAIESGDPDKLCEELGDYLLQALMHAQLDREEGLYDIDDVIAEQTDKLVRRHPHVFGGLEVADVGEVLNNWDKIKAAEKGGEPRSALAGVPRSLPALLRAYEVSKRAARLGFDWPDVSSVLDKVAEECGELREALVSADQERISAEAGDLLFAVANVARKAGLEPEDVLRTMVNTFTARFQAMEQILRDARRDPKTLSPGEWEEIWQRVKASRDGPDSAGPSHHAS